MPALIPIPILKAAIVDTVASGDLPLMALLQDNVDMIWSMNQRRSTAQPVQYMYALSDALRMGMDYTRTSIDAALTDSEALAVKRARALSSRIYDASNSASGTMALTVDGTGHDDEVGSRITDMTNSSSESSYHSISGSSSGTDFSKTQMSTTRDTNEFNASSINTFTRYDDNTNVVTGTRYRDNTLVQPGEIHSDIMSVDIGIVSRIVPIQLGIKQGVIDVPSHLGATSTITKNIIAGGAAPDLNGNMQSRITTVQNGLRIDDHTGGSGGGLLNGSDDDLAELGSGTNSITKRVHSSGGMTTIDHAQRDTSHLASASLHSHADVSASQTSVTSASGYTHSDSVDTAHSEAHELGESSEILSGTIDYLGQLFTNLKTMYTNVCAQITAFESQISVGTRYVNNRMTTKVPPSPLPCNTSVTWLTNLSLNGNPTSWWGI